MDIKNGSFILTISYGNYLTGTGGTDKVILSQSRIFHEHNVSTVHLFPQIGVRNKKPGLLWGLVIDGEYCACLSIEQAVEEIKGLCDCGKELKAVLIHHLQWMNLDDVDFLLSQVHSKVFLYLHDYMTVCPSGGLVRNKGSFCGPDRPNEEKCRDCCYYTEKNLTRLEKTDGLIDKIRSRLTVIAPSETAAGIWMKSHKEFSESVVVLLHQKLSGEYCGNLRPKGSSEALKIAFVGYQSELKGWPQWIDAVKRAKEQECNYEFFQFGTVKDHFDFIREVEVDFKKSLTAMTDALREYEIDIAVLWSIWPETYSYTYYEALAANCFVLTSDAGGNIKEQARIRGNGLVYPNTCLADLLPEEQRLRAELNRFRHKQQYGPEQLQDNDDILKLIESRQE